ncbi:hypothetical protein HMPREF2809_08620 [Enterococcus sp. HMSC055G03]|uniref:hypothetical protein n=1 Tax=Enterococcus sp. S177_ASV_20 TaxID=2847007 RepID=UPI0008A393A5|nr:MULTISPECIES: hypothetical protein [unclassified Enterococcus]OFK63570.1 hypothetical protein HMPREF2809_08620 [Enterococcus sp. HMSC055G03]
MPYLESIAVINDKELVIFAVNRGEEEMNLTVHLSELSLEGVIDFSEMSGFDTKATNLPKSEQVKPSHSTNVKAEDGKINCLLKPLSWNVVRCRLSDEGGTKNER